MHYKLIYTSRANGEVTDKMLDDILSTAREHNNTKGISGILLYFKGDFIQVLEGPRHEVQDLFERIEKDPRHTDVDLIFEEFQEDRTFASWRMAYLPLSDETARAINGNLDVNSIDQLAKVLKQPSKILQFFFKKILQEMAAAANVRHAEKANTGAA